MGQIVYQLTISGWVPIISEGVSKTLFDAKGDLLLGTGNDAVARQAVGANGTLLVADSAEATGVKWRLLTLADLPAGYHPDLAAHDAMGLATDTDVTDAVAAEAAARAAGDALLIPLAQKGAANGVAPLVGGLLPTAHLPTLSINEIYTVNTQAAMLALAAERGDMAIRTDLSATYVLSTDDPTQLANWKQLPVPSDAVQSVNGQTGIVVLGPGDVGAAAASHGHPFTAITGQIDDAQIPGSITRDTEVTAAIDAHKLELDPHPGYLTSAEGDLAYAPAGHSHALDDLSDVDGVSSRDVGDVLAWDGLQWEPTAPAAGGGLTFTTVEKDLGSDPRRGGTFDLTGLSGLTPGKPVLIQQAAGPYTGKGDREDEAEMDLVTVSAYVVDGTTIRAYWQGDSYLKGNVKFSYAVSA